MKTYLLSDVINKFIDYRGKTPPKTNLGIPLITAKIIKGGTVMPPNEFIAEDFYDEWMTRGIPKKGDVIITTEAPLGEVAQVKTDDKLAFAQRLIILQPNRNILDADYLLYSLQSRVMQYRLGARMTGTTVTGIKSTELKKVKIDLPPLPVQHRIAAILSSLDDKIENNRKTCVKLEEIAQAIFKRWFVDFEFPNEDGLPYKSSCGEMVVCEDLGKEIPKGWTVGRFTDIASVLSGGTPKTSITEYWNGDIPFFTPKDCDSGFYVISTEKYLTRKGLANCNSQLYARNTVLITARGTVGKIALCGCEMAMNQSCYALKAKDNISQYFIFLLLNEKVRELKMGANGAVFDAIVVDTFRALQVVRPPLHIIKNFDQAIKSSFEKMLVKNCENIKLVEIRDALLPKLMSGELAVEEEDRIGIHEV